MVSKNHRHSLEDNGSYKHYMCLYVCLSRYSGLYHATYETNFDETRLMLWKLDSTDYIEISWKPIAKDV